MEKPFLQSMHCMGYGKLGTMNFVFLSGKQRCSWRAWRNLISSRTTHRVHISCDTATWPWSVFDKGQGTGLSG